MFFFSLAHPFAAAIAISQRHIQIIGVQNVYAECICAGHTKPEGLFISRSKRTV